MFEYFVEIGISTLEIGIDGSTLLASELFIFFLLKKSKFEIDLPMIHKSNCAESVPNVYTSCTFGP